MDSRFKNHTPLRRARGSGRGGLAGCRACGSAGSSRCVCRRREKGQLSRSAKINMMNRRIRQCL